MGLSHWLQATKMSGGSNGFTTDEEHALMTGNLITCTVSAICSGGIVVSMLYLCCKSRREAEPTTTLLDLLHFRLVFLLSLSDVLYSFAMLMGDPDDKSDLCYFQAIFSSFFELCSLGWVLAIATTLWGQFVRKWPQDHIEPACKAFLDRLLLIFSVTICTVSLVLTLLPLTADTYGDSGAWCWIDDSDTGQVMRYLTFYVWLWLGITGIFVMYYQLMSELSSLIPDTEKDKGGFCHESGRMIKLIVSSEQCDDVNVAPVRRVMRRLCMYPIVLIVCWLFGTINRLQNSFDPDNPSIVLFWLHMWFSNLNGFGNAIVYGFNDSLRNDLKKYCCASAADTPKHSTKDTNLEFAVQTDEISVDTDTPIGGGGNSEPSGVKQSTPKGKNMNPI